MYYQVDRTRLLVLLVLLGSGIYVVTRATQLPPASSTVDLARRRIAIRGMLMMTLLGLVSGLVGGLTEDVAGEAPHVRVLHAIYSVCWAPAFATHHLAQRLDGSEASSRAASEILGLLGLALIPILWFLVSLGVAHLLVRRRPG